MTSQRDGGGSFRQLKWVLGPEDPSPSAAGRRPAGSVRAGAGAAALGLSHPPRIEALGAAGRPESDGESRAARGAEPAVGPAVGQPRRRLPELRPRKRPGGQESTGLAAAAAMELRVGNRYRLGRKIGSGSFGDIYLGEAPLPPGPPRDPCRPRTPPRGPAPVPAQGSLSGRRLGADSPGGVGAAGTRGLPVALARAPGGTCPSARPCPPGSGRE